MPGYRRSIAEMSHQNSLDSDLQQALDARSREHLLRARRVVRAIDSVHLEVDRRRVVNFCSNDYLGLAHHPRVIEAVASSAREHGAGSAASPLVCGYTDVHARCEERLARWKGTQSSVLLPSGYQTNLAAIQTLADGAHASGRKIRFLLDKLSHASLIDAVRASTMPFRADARKGTMKTGTYPFNSPVQERPAREENTGGAPVPRFRTFAHNDMNRLQRLLERADPDEIQIVLTESIFSMDGDAAALEQLVAMRRRRGFFLMLDEAHGSGVYGPEGSGLAAERGLSDQIDLFIVTLSKAMGLAGGAVCGSKIFCDALVNFGRAYVYSTAVPPTIPAGVMAALDVMCNEPQRQERVRLLAQRFRKRLIENGLDIPRGDSPIVPVILGEAARAIAAAESLYSAGLLVQPIRPPTVPPAQSRLRITLSAEHSDEEVERLVEAVIGPRG
jgi:8-amino-7-oxononanoate synthase